MKNLLNIDYLSNLSEKSNGEYINYHEANVPELWNKIADDLMKKIKNITFKEDDHDFVHYFIDGNKSLANELGFDKIIVCPYKGQEVTYKDSNYIYDNYNDKTLTIDIYDVGYLKFNITRDRIIQELFNFKRDAEWLNDSVEVYERKMEEMKKSKKLFEDFV